MSEKVPYECQQLGVIQEGVLSRQQALHWGMSEDAVKWLVRSGRWQQLHPGVYAISSGAPSRKATLWAAVLYAGRGAALSHHTAAELFKIVDKPAREIHVTIPQERRVWPPAGIVVHRSRKLAAAIAPGLEPPRTRIEVTVLDLVDDAPDFDAAFNVACAACQRRVTKADRLLAAMARRTRLRWRAELTEALGHVGAGVHSMLEYRYVRLVEKPHGLPPATRQAKVTAGDRDRYLDNLYPDYRLCVELDGLQAHPEDQRWQDLRRINAITEKGLVVLRYGWTDINSRPCETAAQVAAVLRKGGWPGQLSPCSPTCKALRYISP
jgi:hypothetical protein